MSLIKRRSVGAKKAFALGVTGLANLSLKPLLQQSLAGTRRHDLTCAMGTAHFHIPKRIDRQIIMALKSNSQPTTLSEK
jgi:formate-dependent nitrite reductase cytochrome c552 subunit